MNEKYFEDNSWILTKCPTWRQHRPFQINS